jgi:hypothetical protein
MNNVERFKNVMAFKPVDRLPTIEWAHYWDKTVDRWYQDGLPRSITDVVEIRRHFGLDCYRQFWIVPRGAGIPAPQSHGAALINNRDDYIKIKPYLFPKPAFDGQALERWAYEQKKGETVLWFTFEGFFWFPRTLFGIEHHMFAFYDHPELMHDMNRDVLEYNLNTLDEICKICTPDFMTFAEDMSYNNGPMLSKSCFDEFITPYYQKIVPRIKERGILPFVDSDGDVTTLIPWLESVGIEGILPLERMAGVDVARIRKDHPKFGLIGAFDKTIMHLGEAAMRKEFERLLPTMRQGGFIPSVDHQTPPDVSMENYQCYVRLLKEYSQLGSPMTV